MDHQVVTATAAADAGSLASQSGQPGHYLRRSEDIDGYPNLAFEHWYQQGMSSYMARLPRALRKQALKACIQQWQKSEARRGGDVGSCARHMAPAYWMLRAFAYGATGRDSEGLRTPAVAEGYVWPEPPDAAWALLVCAYPDGECDLDMVHPVSRRFWSEDNDFFEPPGPREIFNRSWYESMGFEVMRMSPAMTARVDWAPPKRHLSVVRQ
ncbi:hypothetical protein ACOTHJ_12970 [Achromobacter xylosoxidans]|uniref:hypothetical protein n=1 Tax=Achromobacter anxifer TaxID=1287737 RepID=UPI001C377826|nr:hypothetical protein [Achromobacter anxifer]